jgi:hypothetical protein
MGTKPITAKNFKPEEAVKIDHDNEIDHDKLMREMRRIFRHKPLPRPNRKKK